MVAALISCGLLCRRFDVFSHSNMTNAADGQTSGGLPQPRQFKAQIRKYRPTDAPSVVELFKAGMLYYGRRGSPQLLEAFEGYVERSLQDDLPRIEEVYDLNKPPHLGYLGCFWVAVHPEDDNGILGMVGLQAVDVENKIAELRRMSISEKARRTGLGSQLLGKLESWATEQGFCKVVLSTLFSMRPACLFYEANGFVESRREEHVVEGDAVVYYEKSLVCVPESGTDTAKRAA